jgi:hypothetical protein
VIVFALARKGIETQSLSIDTQEKSMVVKTYGIQPRSSTLKKSDRPMLLPKKKDFPADSP